ncbi:hypothetical protein G6F24_013800 [Rhizopus arrhizus]|nr:hypothetical protein G6F24_013800 [Rhizopus arrhizus]
MHVGRDQAHAAAQELLVDLAVAGPLVVAQVFRIGAVIKAVAVAETAVIGKSEVSGHCSARTQEVDAGCAWPMRSAMQMHVRWWPVQTRCDAVATACRMAGETPDWNVCVEETGNVSYCRPDSSAFDFEMVKTIDQYGQVDCCAEHTAAFCMHIHTQFPTST